MNATFKDQRSDNTPAQASGLGLIPPHKSRGLKAQASGLGLIPPHKSRGLKARNNTAISLQIIDNPNSRPAGERIGEL